MRSSRFSGKLSSNDSWIGYSTIYGRYGEHETPYMTRFWIGRLRLHIFHRPDQDPDCHDHPWDFWTLPLTSYVEEIVVDLPPDIVWDDGKEEHIYHQRKYTYRQLVRAFEFHHRSAEHTHRVLGRWDGRYKGPFWDAAYGTPSLETKPGKVVTIVWRGPVKRHWGFLRNRLGQWCWTPWREYVFGGGKDAPCS